MAVALGTDARKAVMGEDSARKPTRNGLHALLT